MSSSSLNQQFTVLDVILWVFCCVCNQLARGASHKSNHDRIVTCRCPVLHFLWTALAQEVRTAVMVGQCGQILARWLDTLIIEAE